MVPKLSAFYMKAILPELAVPRNGLSPGIREPDKPWVHIIPVIRLCTTHSVYVAGNQYGNVLYSLLIILFQIQ